MKAQSRFAELQKRAVLIDKRLSTLERAITASDQSAALKIRQEVILQRICSLEGSHVEVITRSLSLLARGVWLRTVSAGHFSIQLR